MNPALDNKDLVIEAQKMRIQQLEGLLATAVDTAHYVCTGEHPSDKGKPAHRSVEEAGVANRQ